jgi:predicted outer membrane repeat protein
MAAWVIAAFATVSSAQIYVDHSATGADNGTSWTDAYASLQSALLAAVPDDEIWVAAGTYKPTTGTNRDIRFEIDSRVRLYGGFDGTETMRDQRDWVSNPTILSGEIGNPDISDNCFHVIYAIASAPATVVDGFTITRAFAAGIDDYDDYGGGMQLINSSITVANVIIEDNTCRRYGGGVYIEGGAPTFTDVTIRNNNAGYKIGGTTYVGIGAGVYATLSDVSMTRVTFTGNGSNSVNYPSDGMYSIDGEPTLTDCTFDANFGTGLYNRDGRMALHNILFTHHTSVAMLSTGTARLDSCTFEENYSGGMSAADDTLNACLFLNNSGTYGAGLATYENTPVLTDCDFIGNTATNGGGAMYCPRSNIELTNVRFIDNAALNGGAMYYYGDGFSPGVWQGPRMANVLFTGNHATSNGGAIYSYTQGPVETITNVTIVDNTADGDGGAIFNRTGTGTVTNAIIWGNDEPQVVNHSTHLLTFAHSVVGGSGGSGAWDTSVGIDGGNNLDADPWFVDQSGGDYRLSLWSPCINAGDNSAPFLPSTDIVGNPRINDGTVDMGIYEFKCETGTILYVDADATGNEDGSSWENASTTLRLGLGLECGEVSEIWVAEGVYTPTAGDDRMASFRLPNSVGIYGGFAGTETLRSQRKPGLYPTILSGEIGGPGLTDNSYHVVTGTGADSTAILDGFIVEGGFANGAYPNDRGAGMFNNPGGPTVTGVVFRGNTAQNGGGAMLNFVASAPRLANVVFDGNDGGTAGGGAMYNLLADVTLTNVTMANNTAFGSGGAMYSNGGNITITNTIVWGNTPSAAQVSNISGSPLVSHSLIEGCGASGSGWNAAVGSDGGGNLDEDPLFVDAANGDLHIDDDSPAIDSGDDTAPNLPSTDADGNQRIFGVTVDMGAYEHFYYIVGAEYDAPSTATRLGAPYPNPFNPSVTIAYELKSSERVELSIYDVGGRLVRTLVDGVRDAGVHEESWNGRDRSGNSVASGVYFVVMRAGAHTDIRKITLLK